MKILKGNRNQCPTCHQYFNSTGAFEKHRTGTFGVNRRCMTPSEMEAKGMFLKPDGFWIGEKMVGYRSKENDDEDTVHN